MSVEEIVVRLARALRRAGVRYVIGGGAAAMLLGSGRAARDISLVIDAKTEDDVIRVCESLSREGFHVVTSWALDAFRERTHWTILADAPVHIDCKFASTDLELSSVERCITIRMGEEEVALMPVEELIALKLGVLGALEDIEDALRLMLAHGEKLDWARLAKLVGGDPLDLARHQLEEFANEAQEEPEFAKRVAEIRKLIQMVISLRSRS